MSNLREIVKGHIISETKKEWTNISPSEQNTMITYLENEGLFDRKVDVVLNAFREELEKDSPESKKRKINKFYYAGLNVIFTPAIAYSVNIENWVMVVIFSILTIIVNAYFTFFAD